MENLKYETELNMGVGRRGLGDLNFQVIPIQCLGFRRIQEDVLSENRGLGPW